MQGGTGDLGYWPEYGEVLAFELREEAGTIKVAAKINGQEIKLRGVAGGVDFDVFKSWLKEAVLFDSKTERRLQ